MKMTFRHYGNDDPISLEYIAQIPGVTGVMVMMNEWEAGEAVSYTHLTLPTKA